MYIQWRIYAYLENYGGYGCSSRPEKYGLRSNVQRPSHYECEKSRRAEKLAENDVFEETEGLLYAPGIADFSIKPIALIFEYVILHDNSSVQN